MGFEYNHVHRHGSEERACVGERERAVKGDCGGGGRNQKIGRPRKRENAH